MYQLHIKGRTNGYEWDIASNTFDCTESSKSARSYPKPKWLPVDLRLAKKNHVNKKLHKMRKAKNHH
jgi:hypothetical protein